MGRPLGWPNRQTGRVRSKAPTQAVFAIALPLAICLLLGPSRAFARHPLVLAWLAVNARKGGSQDLDGIGANPARGNQSDLEVGDDDRGAIYGLPGTKCERLAPDPSRSAWTADQSSDVLL